MSKTLATQWSVLPHGPLEPQAENLWRIVGDLPEMSLKRVMTVARSQGQLALHSCIALDEAGMKELEALGTPTWLIVPNGWHTLDAARYIARYPDIKVVCPAQSKKMVEKKVQRVDGTYEEFPWLDADSTIGLEAFDSQRHMEGAMIVKSTDGVTLVFGDSLFNLPHQKGLFWWFYGRVLGSTGGPRVTLIGRTMMKVSRSTSSYKAFLQRQRQAGNVVRLIPGHGDVVSGDVNQVLEEIVRSL